MSKFIKRIQEPSTHAGIGLAIASIAGMLDGLISWQYGIPTLIPTLLAIFLPEGTKK